MADESGLFRASIENVHPQADGEYETNLINQPLTGDEWHLIKKISGVRPGDLDEAVRAIDYDLIVAFGMILLRRNGKKIPVEMLMAAPAGNIILDFGEDDAGPPEVSETPSSRNEESASSGKPSNGTGDHPETTPAPTGSPG